jgi:hypothetical protein
LFSLVRFFVNAAESGRNLFDRLFKGERDRLNWAGTKREINIELRVPFKIADKDVVAAGIRAAIHDFELSFIPEGRKCAKTLQKCLHVKQFGKVEIGTHHHIRRQLLAACASEMHGAKTTAA